MFTPLHLGELERSKYMEGWIKSWWETGLEKLIPEGWFPIGQAQGNFLCTEDPEAT